MVALRNGLGRSRWDRTGRSDVASEVAASQGSTGEQRHWRPVVLERPTEQS